VHAAVDGLSEEELSFRVDPEANTIAWLVWHLTRIQDDHVAEVAGAEQTWTSRDWAKRFALPLNDDDTGYGHSPDQVASVTADAETLTAYFDAVHQQTLAFVGELSATDLERVVDKRWDPPVTLAVRLVSVISDDLQHAGQAAFIRGIARRR
jgi:uncharacterized damage-inducible protein DinB